MIADASTTSSGTFSGSMRVGRISRRSGRSHSTTRSTSTSTGPGISGNVAAMLSRRSLGRRLRQRSILA